MTAAACTIYSGTRYAFRRGRRVAGLVALLAVSCDGGGDGRVDASSTPRDAAPAPADAAPTLRDATPTPLGTPMSGLDDETEVVFGYGMAISLAGIERVWSAGVGGSDSFAIFLSSAELSCATDLQAKNPPQGYTLRIMFSSLEVGATADDYKLYRHANGWLDTSGAERGAEAKITAADTDSFSGTVSIDWKWYTGKVGSLAGDFDVVSCLTQ